MGLVDIIRGRKIYINNIGIFYGMPKWTEVIRLSMKRIIQAFKVLSIDIATLFFTFDKTSVNNDDILIVRLDAIGDYVLFRNFIEDIYNYYGGKKRIVLCGNILWKNLAERLDRDYIAQFIWLDPKKLYKPSYLFSAYRKVRAVNCGILLHPVYSRTPEGDALAIHSGAKQIIGWDGDTRNINIIRKERNNRKYTKLIPAFSKSTFEFDRNRFFCETFLNVKLVARAPFINNSLTNNSKGQYIMIFPGAGTSKKRWAPDNFVELCKLLQKNTKLPIRISGGNKDIEIARKIMSQIQPPCYDCTGKFNLSDTLDMIANASLVIANDTGPVHLSAMLRRPTVCISHGGYYGRFIPYPPYADIKLEVVRPDEIDEILDKEEDKNGLSMKTSFVDINLIKPEKVYGVIKRRFIEYIS